MKIVNLGSGSSGNCYLICGNKANVVIECGISYGEACKRNGGSLPPIDLILVSHEHTDHAKYLKNWLYYNEATVFATKGTIEAALKRYGEIPAYMIETAKKGVFFNILGCSVTSFSVHHDAADPTGFILEIDGEKILYATDTFKIDYRFKNISIFLIECNYSRDLLLDWYNSSDTGKIVGSRLSEAHFELEDSIEFVKNSFGIDTKAIYLIHISTNDGDPDLFESRFEKEFPVPVYICQRYGGIR